MALSSSSCRVSDGVPWEGPSSPGRRIVSDGVPWEGPFESWEKNSFRRGDKTSFRRGAMDALIVRLIYFLYFNIQNTILEGEKSSFRTPRCDTQAMQVKENNYIEL